ncbi:MAG: flavin reductase family protein [Sulfitobacter sp.]
MSSDVKELRSAFGRFMTGVTVVTTLNDTGDPVGFTANSFTSVSLDPPLLLVCPGQHLSSFEVFQSATTFGVSVLSEGQEAVSNLFASNKADRFAQSNWTTPAEGIPLITGRAAGFVCRTSQAIPAGDHVVLIGEVVHFDSSENPGLGYGPDGYFALGKERKAEAHTTLQTRASVLLDDGKNLFLTADLNLPSVTVNPDQSPLRELKSALERTGIQAKLSVVYAVYDEGKNGRRIVFRGQPEGALPNLTAHAIDDLSALSPPDRALRSLLTRFESEHKAQSFGFYIGNECAGDVLPALER